MSSQNSNTGIKTRKRNRFLNEPKQNTSILSQNIINSSNEYFGKGSVVTNDNLKSVQNEYNFRNYTPENSYQRKSHIKNFEISKNEISPVTSYPYYTPQNTSNEIFQNIKPSLNSSYGNRKIEHMLYPPTVEKLPSVNNSKNVFSPRYLKNIQINNKNINPSEPINRKTSFSNTENIKSLIKNNYQMSISNQSQTSNRNIYVDHSNPVNRISVVSSQVNNSIPLTSNDNSKILENNN